MTVLLVLVWFTIPACGTECQSWEAPGNITVAQPSAGAAVTITVTANYGLTTLEGPFIEGSDITYYFDSLPCGNLCIPLPPFPHVTTVFGNLMAGTHTVHLRWRRVVTCETTQQFTLAQAVSIPASRSLVATSLAIVLVTIAAVRIR